MKLFMKILVCVFALSVLFSMLPFQSICSQLEKDVLRLHILANSDTDFDQNIKLQVRDKVLEKVSYLYDSARTKEDAKRITNENLAFIEQMANEELKRNNIPYTAKAEVKNIYFNTRYYDNFTMPAGYYDALQIVLGKGQGHNWWCVMYPSLCVGTATDGKMKEDLSKNEYNVVTAKDFTFRFKVVEYYEKLRSYFN